MLYTTFRKHRNPVFGHFPSFPASSFMPRVTYLQYLTQCGVNPGLYSVRRSTQTELRKRIYADTRVMAFIVGVFILLCFYMRNKPKFALNLPVFAVLQVAILARSPREMSLTDRILPRYILSRVRVSVRPRIFYTRKKTKPGSLFTSIRSAAR